MAAMDVQGEVPVDEVSLHVWSGDTATPAEQIGESIHVTELGRVVFPPHRGEPAEVQVIAWFEGRAMWGSGPKWVFDGDTVSVQVPLPYTISLA